MFLLRSLVFLVLHYNAAEGITFFLISHYAPTLIKDIFPFVIILAITALFVRMYRKPGRMWFSYFCILAMSFSLWVVGFDILHSVPDKDESGEQISLLFTGYIHDVEDARVYINEKEDNTLHRPIFASLDRPLEKIHVSYPDVISDKELKENSYFTMSPQNPVFSPIINISPMFNRILREFTLFKQETYRLYDEDRIIFYIISLLCILFFLFSSILLKLRQFPLFLVVVTLVTLRFFFFLYTAFVGGLPALLLDTLIRREIYTPIFGIGYFASLFMFITIRYSLVHKRKRSLRED